jgi:hypothetical protein
MVYGVDVSRENSQDDLSCCFRSQFSLVSGKPGISSTRGEGWIAGRRLSGYNNIPEGFSAKNFPFFVLQTYCIFGNVGAGHNLYVEHFSDKHVLASSAVIPTSTSKDFAFPNFMFLHKDFKTRSIHFEIARIMNFKST